LTRLRPFRQNARDNWSANRWRLHRWAYCRLTEMVDAQIGKVLEALRQTGLTENTLVVLTSAHGDMDAAHRLEHKTVFYEEASRIPMVLSYPGRIQPGRVNREHLVSNGLDLLPTLCDYAGIESPRRLEGRSLRPLAEGRSSGKWRQMLFVQSQIGYMVTDGRYKYSAFDPDKGAHREFLADLQSDPGEMRNIAGESDMRGILHRLRAAMAGWQRQNNIRFEMPG